MKECYCYNKSANNSVNCYACSHRCVIVEGKTGICGVRKNLAGTLYSLVYDKIIALHIDSIEKKPLFHFYPGSKALSIGTVGCNLSCLFCQNYEISFPREKVEIKGKKYTPKEIVNTALDNNCKSIAYTYTEPAIFIELVYDIGILAKKKGIKNILITNGYFTKEAIDFLEPIIDAMNIDLKSYSNSFYKDTCNAKLKPVLESIKYAYDKGIWIELTTLLIPGKNDSNEELIKISKFIQSISPTIPWHITRFTPLYKMLNPPQTLHANLQNAKKIGENNGINYVYLGNISDEQLTFCPSCHEILVKRHQDFNDEIIINYNNGNCPNCQHKLDGRFK